MLAIVPNGNKFSLLDTDTDKLVTHSGGGPYTRDTLVAITKLRENLIVRSKTSEQNGYISIENIPQEFGPVWPLGPSHMEGLFQITTGNDGRVWININGLCFLRFKPSIKEATTQGTTGTCPQCQKQSQPFSQGQDICDICLKRQQKGKIIDNRCNNFYVEPETGICEALGRYPTEKDCKACTCPLKGTAILRALSHPDYTAIKEVCRELGVDMNDLMEVKRIIAAYKAGQKS